MPAPSMCYLRDIQTLFDSGTAGSLSDRQLLERFLGGRDGSVETAFEALVLRHGPMVLRVCQNVLQDPADAEDAFQATFLVLVKRCRSIRRLESVGSWLYGVSLRVASQARRDSARRRAAERKRGLSIMVGSDPRDQRERENAEFGPVVQEEVQRLPEKYRAVVLLCYWQGLTQEQTAARLNCPLGTVRSRLSRARRLLHRRLAHCGLAPLAGALAFALDGAVASAQASRLAPVAAALIQSTVRAGCRAAAGQATAEVVSAGVASLIHRVLWSMTMIKVKGVAICLVLVGLVGYGTGLTVQQARGARAIQTAGAAKPPQTAPGGRELQAASSFTAQPGHVNNDSNRPGETKIYSKTGSVVIAVRPDRSILKKGEIICELDSAGLRDTLANQRITLEAAKAKFANARITKETAQIAVVEYEQGLLKMRLEELAGDVKIAEAELAVAKDDLKDAGAGDEVARKIVKQRELAVLRAEVGLEKARSRDRILREFTGPKKTKTLEAGVEMARANERASKMTFDLESEKARRLEEEIAACTIVAPRDGRLLYGVEGLFASKIVGQRQHLFTIVPADDSNPKDQ